ncbi:hypothetical protein BK138_32365 [Paenibacillus rhizosphaerae]|uniref:Hydrolase n=1 Tax=Paenibacillus rhizosphaerae TaxID=297318 RepID=A0A1R1E534_9BACL|nr:hypothetical protein [Paenibacillus rhizosphaerae]OMF46920.1 hypothetical protein BK138_32365 [Paenibacillus rhizosphaerae]
MNKKKYYISVQSKSIFQQQGEAPYELEIEATEQQVIKLRNLFDKMEECDIDSMIRTPTPGIPYHHDHPNDSYDYYLKQIYQMIYDLGTIDTQQHVSSIMDRLDTMG